MIRILANDGIHPDGQLLLEEANYEVDTNKIPQEELINKLQDYDAIIVRSATKVRKELIDACPRLKIIARAGVGLDNIDVDYAREKGIKVINTPKASSLAVAELVLGQIFSLSRYLYQANRAMPQTGSSEFKQLKKRYAQGLQVSGRKLGIIGFGRIGQELARLAMGIGMEVLATDLEERKVNVYIKPPAVENASLAVELQTVPMEQLLEESDFISIHVPSGKDLITAKEMAQMKKGVCIINTSRGGVISEADLLAALDSGQLAGAALDVFDNEPSPSEAVLQHPLISATPHIGASTLEAQRYIGLEIADAFIDFFGE
ncbi:D-2-hydroxyacid dehydrogenase [Saprospira sp. CCB-QB6]|uniref:D-2-hydroxyacid dehydrogenase n=1 Tax=Saprospira sp. CCB-QB6 TaxID=3023936 RepID=UPI00234B1F29|nr:D-2-hydroxyacid dehydrogenase [Saprospira sp. CCB-QB6]WCL81909.1 D-2-hydroxyacid dehydrogenase [Saprospira sp. CCB-QB6]